MMNVGGRAVGRAGVNNSFPEDNSATVRNISIKFDRIIEKVSTECPVQEYNSAYLRFLIMSPDPYFYFIFVSGAQLRNRLKYFNDTW